VAVEPLPRLKEFLPAWRALIAQKPAGDRGRDWDTDEDRWLREVVQRLDGSDGLAKIARTTKRADDLRAWCKSLVDAGEWKAALPAFEEAAGLVTDKDYARGELLDGAALAAQHLGRKDLSAWLERAWRAGSSMLRLRRWLGSAGSKATLRKRASEALLACPKQAARQRAFLHVLQGEIEPAAKLLAAAPGLGWSNGEHPGHLLFRLFTRLLGGKKQATSPRMELMGHRGMELEELEVKTADRALEVDQLLRQYCQRPGAHDREAAVKSRSGGAELVGAHTWEFKARFPRFRHAFGWKSQPAITRIKQAVAEIKKVAKTDPVLAAEGAIAFLERVSPALEQVDSSSGSIGTAVGNAIAELVPIIARARRREDARRLARAAVRGAAADQIPYIERLADHWGELCASKEVASAWADKLVGITRMALRPDKACAGTSTGPPRA
jgi:hypothetical protein